MLSTIYYPVVHISTLFCVGSIGYDMKVDDLVLSVMDKQKGTWPEESSIAVQIAVMILCLLSLVGSGAIVLYTR